MTDPIIPTPDSAAVEAAQNRQAQLTKPPGSLGRLEEVVIRLAGLQGRTCPQIHQPAISIFAADHGVTAEGISAFPQAVTGQMLANFAAGGGAINAVARHIGAGLEVVDVGTLGPDDPLPGVRRERAGNGTANFVAEPAMTAPAFEQAYATGAAAAERAADGGADCYIPGEMGIGNTTAAAAVACGLLVRPPPEIIGAGTGLSEEAVHHKGFVVARALGRHGTALEGPPSGIVQHVGGFEIAAMMGSYIKAAELGLPVLVDGFIATTAALAAVRQQPAVAPWLIAAHRSEEAGHEVLLDSLGEIPLLDLGMRLGEASGAAVAVPLIRMACTIHGEMATFESAGIATG